MSPPCRVLRIVARMNVGGPALQITGLARGLDPERFEQRILCGEIEDGEADWLALRAPDVQVVRVPGLARSVGATREARALWAIVRELRSFRPHVLHTHAAKAGALGRTAVRLAGRPPPATVHTFHGHLLHGYFGPAGTALVTAAERLLARRTTRLVAVGERVRDELLAAGVGRPGQYVVIPPGLELPTPPSRMEARRRLGLADHRAVVAYVARLTGVKRPDRMVDTALLLRDALPDAIVLVVGDGPLTEATRAAAAGLGDRIRFLGWRSDVETIYAAADVTVLTSDNEGTPVSLIEAQRCGVPCVSTRVGSVEEVVLDGRTGLLTDRTPEALASALTRILRDDQLRTRMAEAARAHADARFSTKRLVSDHEALYGLVVRERGVRVGGPGGPAGGGACGR